MPLVYFDSLGSSSGDGGEHGGGGGHGGPCGEKLGRGVGAGERWNGESTWWGGELVLLAERAGGGGPGEGEGVRVAEATRQWSLCVRIEERDDGILADHPLEYLFPPRIGPSSVLI